MSNGISGFLPLLAVVLGLLAQACVDRDAAIAGPWDRGGVRLIISPSHAPMGERVGLCVTNLDPGRKIRIASYMKYRFPGGAIHYLSSHADFIADSSGKVDCSSQAPVSGTYGATNSMGLFYSRTPLLNLTNVPSFVTNSRLAGATFFVVGDDHDGVVAVSLFKEDDLSRRLYTGKLKWRGLDGYVLRPRVGKRLPCVIVLHGSEGGDSPWAYYFAESIAARGYVCIDLNYFQAGKLPAELRKIPLEYFGQCIRWAKSRRFADPDRIAVLGGSRGGELALLLGSVYTDIKAVVAYSGSGILQGATGDNPQAAAWTYGGKDLPHAPFYTSGISDIEGLASDPAFSNAVIRAEKINGPILMISGAGDKLWPSARLLGVMTNRLRQHSFQFPYRLLVYKGAGHGFGLPDMVPADDYSLEKFGGNVDDMARASEDSWVRMLDFLKTALGPDRGGKKGR